MYPGRPGCPGRALGDRHFRDLKDQESNAANLCVLSNCADLLPYFKLFDDMVKRDSPSITDEELIKARDTRFTKWFKEYGQENVHKLDHDVYRMSCGPSPLPGPIFYNGYYINGFKFHTLEYGQTRKKMNSGVCVPRCHYKGGVCDFYGILVDIIKLLYFHGYKCLLFKCDWFDPEKGVRVNPINGRVEVKHKAMLASNRPFVLAEQAEQFCFSPFSSSQCEWRAVLKPKPRSNYELLSVDKGVVGDCTHMKGFESIEAAKDVLDAGVGCGEAVKDVIDAGVGSGEAAKKVLDACVGFGEAVLDALDAGVGSEEAAKDALDVAAGSEEAVQDVLDAGVGSMEAAKDALDVAVGPEEVGSGEAAKDTPVAAGSGEAIQDVLDAGVGFMEAAKDALDAAVGPEEAVQDVVDAGIGSREATKDALNAGVDSMETVKDVHDTSRSRSAASNSVCGPPKRKANDTNEQVLEEIRVLRDEMHYFMAKMQKMIETRFQDLESNNRRRL
ncbi:hypothetical protein COLO4_08610 [Corchorus olitorius]|uniref:DUF4216 domain-containing protein n=1 Tax=Corchorus olitorius TaxID=93759 RepID=A0A1R3KF36_9ROSI|nr:hypothetical protein COLO4_08610 [Corchorus olitorius]